MTRRSRKMKAVIDKEADGESWCFECKDGGYLRVCDKRECLKSYHASCVDKDDSFLQSKKYWACAWHKCFSCRKSSYFHCYTCTTAVCRSCLSAADFHRVKGQYGFCNSCLILALLIEDGKDCDSNGEKVDFRDRETVEGLFMEYYVIIKKQEGFELGDLQTREHGMKTEQVFDSGSEEIDEEYQTSDYESEDNARKNRRTRKGKRDGRTKSGNLTSRKSNKNDFKGWGSTSLIDFLSSIGRSTEEKLSQLNVTSIVYEYAKENKLLHPEKKKMIICDERLCSLFKRKTLSKNRVYDLLETHFAENREESDEDEVGYDTEDDNPGIPYERKIKRKLDMERNSPLEELADNLPLGCFASIVVENIKLLYLRRSLLFEMLKQPELFEKKVVGCFVRVKSDPYDYRSRNSHKLMQVRGVGRIPTDQSNMEATLLLSAMPKEVSISLLSDDDFSKEECADLREKVLAGQLERPTMEDLQQKANILHVDITNHFGSKFLELKSKNSGNPVLPWISKELALLPKLIDRANEKGWRRELFEYLERKRRLQTPAEVSKLLENIPKVIPDLDELNPNSEDLANDMSSEKDSPKSILQCNSSITNDVLKDHKASEEETPHCNTSPESKQRISGRPDENARSRNPSKPGGEQERRNSDDESKAANAGENGEMKTYSLSLLRQRRGRRG